MAFLNRVDAGRRLADRLGSFRGSDVVVLGLPRGGVPVAEQVATALHAPLDIIAVRKLGVPLHPELAAGAIGEGGIRVTNDEVVDAYHLTAQDLEQMERRERPELGRRMSMVRRSHPRLSLTDRIAIVVDDGIATGATARAACQVARAHGAARVVLAVPVAPADWRADLGNAADDYVCVDAPERFTAVGQWYADFAPTSDDDVMTSLARNAHRGWDVALPAAGVVLDGHLTLPSDAAAVVVFVHGSGSSRHSPRNQFVANMLNDAGLGTLLFDLLTDDEAEDRQNVFDIELLAHRLVDVTRWLRGQFIGLPLQVAYFGASTGAAAALAAAARPGADIAAVVSRGGRPDLAHHHLEAVRAPTLLVVGGLDHVVLDLNRRAAAAMRCEHRVEVVPGATHLFEEPGTLHQAAALATRWFTGHLRVPTQSGASGKPPRASSTA
jgi:predicted phosphoribosyltransferase/dienelactone hydrolase